MFNFLNLNLKLVFNKLFFSALILLSSTIKINFNQSTVKACSRHINFNFINKWIYFNFEYTF